MIYIITPYLADFKQMCDKNGWNPMVTGGQPRNRDIIWIYDWQQLLGRKLFKADIIIWRNQSHLFSEAELQRIEMEIELRKPR